MPTGASVEEEATSEVADSDTEASIGTTASGDGSLLERNQAGAITLARFLMTVVRQHANIIRSHWGPHANEGLDGVPHTSTGQCPNGQGRPSTGQDRG